MKFKFKVLYLRFVDTDLTDQHFENCLITNVTVLSLSAGCPLDFDYNIYLEEVFHEHLVGQIAILPGALLSALAIGKLGRVKIIGESKTRACRMNRKTKMRV